MLQEIPSPFYHVRVQGEGTSREPGRGPSPEYDHAIVLILDFTFSRSMRNKFYCLCTSQSVVFYYSNLNGLTQYTINHASLKYKALLFIYL